jgi:RimJ/RimL family protein N-acetyltransferase
MIELRPVTLAGHGVRLEPLERVHLEALVTAAGDGALDDAPYVAAGDLVQGRAHEYMDAALAGQASGQMLPWVVRELTGGAIIGSTRYHDIIAEIDRVEIGFTFYARRWQRTHVNSACKLLLLTHAFETLGCQVVAFRVDGLNLTSQRAVAALGANKDGALRHFQGRRDGSVRDIHVYSILASEWPTLKPWLARRVARLRQAIV